MTATGLGPVRHFDEIDSTNRYLVDEAAGGAAEGLVVVAGFQRAGRGRLGRRWEAPAGSNLLVSVLLRPDLPVDALHLCTAITALAARRAAALVAGVDAGIKWPNDLVVSGRKLGGVLAEVVAGPGAVATGRADAVVVGLGLNVRWPPADEEGGAGPPTPATDGATDGHDEEVAAVLARATSVEREMRAAGRALADPSRLVDDLLAALLADLGRRYDELKTTEGRLRQAGEYRQACVTLWAAVEVDLGEETLRGVATDVTPDGHLVVDTGVCLRTVTAGDVVHVAAGGDRPGPGRSGANP